MLTQGTVLQNRYRVTRLIGQGGMSAIYLCDDLHLVGKVWALKQMTAQFDDPKDEQAAVQMFRTEAVTLAHLEHPSLPKVIDYFSTKNYHYLVMEFVEGEDLGKVIRNTQGFLSERQIILWGIEIAKILYFLHQQNPPIIFRDLKPANVMLSKGRIKLIDFGIARLFNPQKSQDTFTFGSPGYASPEHYGGKQTDVRSDVYSLGVCLHELLTKSDPVKNNPAFQFQGIRNLNPAVSQELEDLVNRALSIDPALRPQSALEFKKALETLLGRGDTTQTIPQIQQPLVSASPQTSGQTPQPVPPPPTTVQSPVQPLAAAQPPPTPVQSSPPARRKAVAVKPSTARAAGAPQKKVRGGKRFPLTFVELIIVIAILSILSAIAIPAFKKRASAARAKVVPVFNVPTAEEGSKGQGIQAYYQGRFQEAVSALRTARTLNPRDGETLLYLQNALAAVEAKPQLVLAAVVDKGGAGQRNTESVLRGLALGVQSLNAAGGIKGALLQIKLIPADEKLSQRLAKLSPASGDVLAVLGATFRDREEMRHCEAILQEAGVPNLFLLVNPGREKDVLQKATIAAKDHLGLRIAFIESEYMPVNSSTVEDYLNKPHRSSKTSLLFPSSALTDSMLRAPGKLDSYSPFHVLSFFDPDEVHGEGQLFVYDFSKAFPTVYLDPWAALAYDLVKFMGHLMEKSGPTARPILDSLQWEEYEGITGKFTKDAGLIPHHWVLMNVDLWQPVDGGNLVKRIQKVRGIPSL